MRRTSLVWCLGAVIAGCAEGSATRPDAGPLDALELDAAPPVDAPAADRYLAVIDAGPCSEVTAPAVIERQPVDIILVIDPSSSMADVIDGVEAGFANFLTALEGSNLDYRVILLTLRDDGRVPNGDLYPICVQQPGQSGCVFESERFYHVDINIRSTQAIEQILGSLAQTDGYRIGTDMDRGSEPWANRLRPEARKFFIVVTDDNSRTCDLPQTSSCMTGEPELTALSLEDFPGGPNPFNTLTLGPGILTPQNASLGFEGYVFSAIYGASASNPSQPCDMDLLSDDAHGPTYTTLIRRTGGIAGEICDGASAWSQFVPRIAEFVQDRAEVSCDIAIPTPPDGREINNNFIRPEIRAGALTFGVPRRADLASCTPDGGPAGGWYLGTDPYRVILCPSTCDQLRSFANQPGGASFDVQFVCDVVPF